MQPELYYVTGNAGKFEEIKTFVDRYEPDIAIKQIDVDVDEIQSLDQKKVAIDKVKKAWSIVQKPLLIDDGGIFFAGYNQFPGTLSKHVFQAIGFQGLFKLVDENHKAAFILQMAFTDGNVIELFEGRTDGTIVRPVDFETHPQLPFTAIFKPDGSDKTFAELRGAPEFTHYSFRQQALKKFLAWYKNAK